MENKKVSELKAIAKERGLRRYSKLSKAELIALLSAPILDAPVPPQAKPYWQRFIEWTTNHITGPLKRMGNTLISKFSTFLRKEENQNEIREAKSALKGFAKQYTIDGTDGVDAVSFLNSVQPHVLDVLNKNPETKVALVLTCTMEKFDLKTGEITSIDAPFLSKNEIILQSTDTAEVFEKAKHKMANFQ